jgi:hypothetical protein
VVTQAFAYKDIVNYGFRENVSGGVKVGVRGRVRCIMRRGLVERRIKEVVGIFHMREEAGKGGTERVTVGVLVGDVGE